MAAETVIAFSFISFIFAYLAINTPSEHGPLQILNYILTYLTVFFTGYLGYAATAANENPAGLLLEWNNAFSWILYMVVAYFVIYLLYKGFLLWRTG